MKKRLLFMLTMMVLMVAVCFSASAVNCNDRNPAVTHSYRKTQVVQATCTAGGYDVYRCENDGCTSFYHSNFVDPLGHKWDEKPVYEGRNGDSYYLKSQHCNVCGVNEYEKDGNALAIYFKVEFLNGQAFDVRDEYVTVESYGKTYEIPVKYTVLAEVPVEDEITNTFTGTKVESLQPENYVKEGESITYVGKKPARTKDKRFGEFRFVGWTKDHNYDTVTDTVDVVGSDINYKITVDKVHANAKYYAAWEGVDVSYKTVVYNSDGKQLLVAQNVKHGDTIDYPFSYPTRESETSFDYIFEGWEIGTKTVAGDKYNFYPVNEAHIKDIPIFSGDGIKAAHGKSPRIYTIEFCDAHWNKQAVVDIAYNDDARDNMAGIVYGNYSDDTYLYEYKGYWETDKGHKVYLESFTVPKGSVDHNDPIYLKDDEGNFFKTTGGDNLEIEELHNYYYNNEGYFNKNVLTYVFPVNEKGDYIVNTSGNATCIVVYENGIQLIDINGNRTDFTQEDANNFRNIKVKPSYYQRVIDRKVTIETRVPANELVPEDYVSGLVVQITNENGQLLAAGVTKNNKCELVVPKAEIYNITVASPNDKYYAEKGIVWDVFKAMYDNNENIIMDLSVNKDYTDEHQSRCSCICHNSFFRGIWIRVLNILYRLFKIKYVCCYDMYATIGDLLVYTK